MCRAFERQLACKVHSAQNTLPSEPFHTTCYTAMAILQCPESVLPFWGHLGLPTPHPWFNDTTLKHTIIYTCLRLYLYLSRVFERLVGTTRQSRRRKEWYGHQAVRLPLSQRAVHHSVFHFTQTHKNTIDTAERTISQEHHVYAYDVMFWISTRWK